MQPCIQYPDGNDNQTERGDCVCVCVLLLSVNQHTLLAWWCSPIGCMHSYCVIYSVYIACVLWVPYQMGLFFTPPPFSCLFPHPPLPSQDMLDVLSNVYASLNVVIEGAQCSAHIFTYSHNGTPM